MAVTLSTMLPLGTAAPNFSLINVQNNKIVTINELKSPVATVIMFICNHCPYVKHIQNTLVTVANTYQAKNIVFIAINSNDAKSYPEDNKENMQRVAREKHYPFPYLYDETQDVARAYQAVCTPDFFVFNGELKCVYRGRFDGASPGNDVPVTGQDLAAALDAILSKRAVNPDQKPSMGCNIKWL